MLLRMLCKIWLDNIKICDMEFTVGNATSLHNVAFHRLVLHCWQLFFVLQNSAVWICNSNALVNVMQGLIVLQNSAVGKLKMWRSAVKRKYNFLFVRILLTQPDSFPPSSSWQQMLRKNVNVALVDYLYRVLCFKYALRDMCYMRILIY